MDLDDGEDGNDAPDTTTVASCTLGRGKISLPLQRDHKHLSFMQVSTSESKCKARLAVKDLNNAGYSKLIAKRPKLSTTQFQILSHERWMGHPVTRVNLIPITGWMHQLCVHCVAMGHPILGDLAYGLYGKAHPNGGSVDNNMSVSSPMCALYKLRKAIEDAFRDNGRMMCIHTRRLTLKQPMTNEMVTFKAHQH
jgi:23S rRNA-/tRNA-specific pseudouridylate synthase